MSYYPLFLELTGRRCLVIGGGPVAVRKVEGLLRSGAQVTVISPELSKELRLLLIQPSIEHVARKYQDGDLEGYALAFVATDDRAINAAVSRDGRSCGVWVNCTDDPDYCDFILPAVIRRGEIALAISTGGASRALARALREELEAFLTGDLTQLIQTISEVRAELKERSIRVSPESWNEALKGEFRLLVAQGRAADAKQLLIRRLEDRPCG